MRPLEKNADDEMTTSKSDRSNDSTALGINKAAYL